MSDGDWWKRQRPQPDPVTGVAGESRRLAGDPTYWEDEFTRQARESEQRQVERQQQEQALSLREREYRAAMAEQWVREQGMTADDQGQLRVAVDMEVRADGLRHDRMLGGLLWFSGGVLAGLITMHLCLGGER